MQAKPTPKNKPTRILGIDFGLARMGLALSDERKIIASPLTVFSAEKRTEQTVVKFVAFLAQLQVEYGCEIDEIIIGLPLMMSGKHGLLADEVQHFVKILQQATPIPIKTWDERLSTVQAERSLREGNLTRLKRSKMVDRVSAAIILQNYLDFRSQIQV